MQTKAEKNKFCLISETYFNSFATFLPISVVFLLPELVTLRYTFPDFAVVAPRCPRNPDMFRSLPEPGGAT